MSGTNFGQVRARLVLAFAMPLMWTLMWCKSPVNENFPMVLQHSSWTFSRWHRVCVGSCYTHQMNLVSVLCSGYPTSKSYRYNFLFLHTLQGDLLWLFKPAILWMHSLDPRNTEFIAQNWVISNHATLITMTKHEDTRMPSMCAYTRTDVRSNSIQCQKWKCILSLSDKIRFPQLCIKCGIAKSCPGTHTVLQVPMLLL